MIGCTFQGNSQRRMLQYQGRGNLILRDNCFFGGNDDGHGNGSASSSTEPIMILLPDAYYYNNGTNATYFNSSNSTNSTSPAYYEINNLDFVDIQSSGNLLLMNGVNKSNVVVSPATRNPCGVYVYYHSQYFTGSLATLIDEPSCMTYFDAVDEQDDERKSICSRAAPGLQNMEDEDNNAICNRQQNFGKQQR